MKQLLFAMLIPIAAGAYETVPGEFLVVPKPGKVQAMAVHERLPDGTGLVKGQSEQKLSELKAQGLIEEFEPNYVYRAVGGSKKPPEPLPPWPSPPPRPPVPVKPPAPPTTPTPDPTPPKGPADAPNDPMLGKLWGLNKIGMTGAWRKAQGGGSKGVVVAVIDTGIDYVHPDLIDRVAGPGFSGLVAGADGKDDNGHGSHCAGTIAGTGNNGIGVAGVAYSASVVGAKFLDKNGSGSTAAAIKAIEWAITQPGVKVLSNSWGGGGPSRALQASIQKACDKDILFVVAAGNEDNDNDAAPTWPANYALPCVLTVAATDKDDAFASFSNYGEKTVQVAAPGVAILSTVPGNKYESMSGTSMATPHVAGLAALIRSTNPKLTAVQTREIIESTSDKLGGGLLSIFAKKSVKFGRVNASKAIEEALKR
jgi:subtilisin family serine protease